MQRRRGRAPLLNSVGEHWRRLRTLSLLGRERHFPGHLKRQPQWPDGYPSEASLALIWTDCSILPLRGSRQFTLRNSINETYRRVIKTLVILQQSSSRCASERVRKALDSQHPNEGLSNYVQCSWQPNFFNLKDSFAKTNQRLSRLTFWPGGTAKH
ncbi:hypothetical protein FQZ97_398880 [compost metagenome]